MIRIGLLGAGEIAQTSHLPVLRNLPDMYEIAGIADVSVKLCKEVQKKFNIAQVYSSAEELIKSDVIDAVMILTSDPLHCELALKAMEAGKHIFIEKPLAMNSQDVERLIQAEKQYPNITVMVGYMRRYASPFLKAKEIMENEPKPVEYIRFQDIIREGDFYVPQSTHTYNAGQFDDLPANGLQILNEKKYQQHSVALGENATQLQRNAYQMLLGLGCHSLSAARELVGAPKEVVNVLTSKNGTHLVTLLQYDGFIGTYEMVNDQSVEQFDAIIEIFQGDRKIKIKYETPYIRNMPHTLEVIETTGTETKTTLYGPDFRDAFETELRTFYDCIANHKKPKTTLEDSLPDIQLFEKMAKMVLKEN